MELVNAQTISIEPMLEQDWPAVRSIYVQGIDTGNATFEKSAPDWASWNTGHSSRVQTRGAFRRRCAWLVRSQSSFEQVRVRGRRGGQRICRSPGTRPGNRRETAGLAGRSIRTRRHLDATSGDFPGKYCQRGIAQASGISRCRHERKTGLDGRALAGCPLAGAQK
jgi:hypothetical protein